MDPKGLIPWRKLLFLFEIIFCAYRVELLIKSNFFIKHQFKIINIAKK